MQLTAQQQALFDSWKAADEAYKASGQYETDKWSATPSAQAQARQKAWDAYHASLPKEGGIFGEIGNFLSGIPVVGDIVKGAAEVIGRPGDIVSDPAKFFGSAAAGAAPFLGGVIGPWSKVMGIGGHVLESGKTPNLIGMGGSLIGSLIGGDTGKLIGTGSKLYTAAHQGNPFAALGAVAPYVGGDAQSTLQDIGKYGSLAYNAFENPASLAGAAAQAGGNAMGLNGMWGNILGGAIQGGVQNLIGGGQGTTQQGQSAQNPLQQYLPYLAGAGALAGLFGNSSTANQLTEPFGIKGLFGPGGPYPDAGLGDKALNYANLLGQAGQGQLTQAQGGLPSLSNMGVLGNIQNVMSQQAASSGVADPFTGQGGSTDPYQIQPYQQQQYNTTADMVNQGRQASINNLRTQLAAQGINDPRAIAAAEAQINAGHDKMLSDTQTNLATQAYQNRQNTLQNFESLLPQLYGQQAQSQQQAFGNAQSMLGQGINANQVAADQAIRQYLYSQLNQGGMIGNLLGYGMNPYSNPLTGKPYSIPTQQQTGLPNWLGGTTGGDTSGQQIPTETPPLETGDLGQPYQMDQGSQDIMSWLFGNQDTGGGSLDPSSLDFYNYYGFDPNSLFG